MAMVKLRLGRRGDMLLREIESCQMDWEAALSE